jgi:hypothetical protein
MSGNFKFDFEVCLFTNRFCDKSLKVPQITHQNKSLQTLEISRWYFVICNRSTLQNQKAVGNQNQTKSRKLICHFESVTRTKGKHSDIPSRISCLSCLLSYYVTGESWASLGEALFKWTVPYHNS